MDRRDALKKLGMGGATVVGASMVVSSPALANPGTEDCDATSGTPSITAVKTGGSGSASTSAGHLLGPRHYRVQLRGFTNSGQRADVFNVALFDSGRQHADLGDLHQLC